MVKKLIHISGMLFMISGIIFLLIHSFIVTGSPDESFSRDLFGFPIPHPPVWTSYIPYLGSFLDFLFQFFSLHGLIGIVLTGVLLYIGGLLLVLGGKGAND